MSEIALYLTGVDIRMPVELMDKTPNYSASILVTVATLSAAILGSVGYAAQLGFLPDWVFIAAISVVVVVTLLLLVPLVLASLTWFVEKWRRRQARNREKLLRELVHHDFATHFHVIADRLEKLTSTSYSMGFGHLLNSLVDVGIIDHALRQAHYVHLVTINYGITEIRKQLASNSPDTVAAANSLAIQVSSYSSIGRLIYDSSQAFEHSGKASNASADDRRKMRRLGEEWASAQEVVNRLSQDFAKHADSINGHLGFDAVRSHFERILSWPIS